MFAAFAITGGGALVAIFAHFALAADAFEIAALVMAYIAGVLVMMIVGAHEIEQAMRHDFGEVDPLQTDLFDGSPARGDVVLRARNRSRKAGDKMYQLNRLPRRLRS